MKNGKIQQPSPQPIIKTKNEMMKVSMSIYDSTAVGPLIIIIMIVILWRLAVLQIFCSKDTWSTQTCAQAPCSCRASPPKADCHEVAAPCRPHIDGKWAAERRSIVEVPTCANIFAAFCAPSTLRARLWSLQAVFLSLLALEKRSISYTVQRIFFCVDSIRFSLFFVKKE